MGRQDLYGLISGKTPMMVQGFTHVGPSCHVVHLVCHPRHDFEPLRENTLLIQGLILLLKVFWRIHGLRGGTGPIGWSARPLCGPTTTKCLSFEYLQANNDMYMWNHVICTKITTTMLVYSQKGCFINGFDSANL